MTTNRGPVLPFTDADLIGPGDRPRPEWEIVMYDWRAYSNPTVKGYLDEMDGTTVRAVQMAPKPEEGVIYLRACSPTAPKAHNVTPAPDHRTANFSLYTPLLAFNFPKLGDKYKATFQCRPEVYGDTKVLVIQVSGYKVEKVDKETAEQAAAAVQAPAQQGGEAKTPSGANATSREPEAKG